MDPTDIVRTSLEAGEALDLVALSLIQDHKLAQIPAIKALRSGESITTNEAKEVVHRNLPLERQAAAERLWEEMIEHAERMLDDDA